MWYLLHCCFIVVFFVSSMFAYQSENRLRSRFLVELCVDVFPVCRCVCQHGGVSGPSAGAGGLFQVHHSGTQRDLSDAQTAPKRHGGTTEAARRQERHHGAVREPVSLLCSYCSNERVCIH